MVNVKKNKLIVIPLTSFQVRFYKNSPQIIWQTCGRKQKPPDKNVCVFILREEQRIVFTSQRFQSAVKASVKEGHNVSHRLNESWYSQSLVYVAIAFFMFINLLCFLFTL